MSNTNPLIQPLLHELDELKAKDVKVLDVREMTSITDTLIIATGTSNRHVKALADKMMETSKRHNNLVLSCEGMEDCEWVLVDLGDIVVHLMQPRIRDYYHLEGIWDLSLKKLKRNSNDPSTHGSST